LARLIWTALQAAGRELSPLTDEQRRELDTRSDELDRDLAAGRPAGIPWEEVLRRIKHR